MYKRIFRSGTMNCIGSVSMKLSNEIRMLWFQHSEWTRMAFVSVIFENPDESEVINRLLRNPVDFANFLRNFFGDAMATQFCKLLTEHLELAVELVRATMADDQASAEKINKRLYENADEISALLASVNPYWVYECWRRMFYRHLDLAKAMAGQLIDGNYLESIETYDRFEAEVMDMADMMVRGIVR